MDIFFDNAEHPCRPDTARSLSPINFFWRSRMLSDGRLSSRGWRCWCHTPHHTWPEASVPRGTVSVSVRLLACWSSGKSQAKDFRFLRSRVSNFPSLYYRLVDAVEHSRFFDSQFSRGSSEWQKKILCFGELCHYIHFIIYDGRT